MTLRAKFCVIGTGAGGPMCWSSTQAVFQRNPNFKTS
jgi:hypothetical protein